MQIVMLLVIYIFYSISGLGFGYTNITQSYNCSGVCVGLENSLENSSEINTDYVDEIDVQSIYKITANLTSVLRFATPCETPNFEVAICIEISKCPVLDAIKSKRKYAEFVKSSQCGPENADKSDIRVCCGKYNGFRNVSKNIATPSFDDDINILPKKCGTQKFIMRGRIVGGTEAALGEFPWMARIIHKNMYGQKSYGCAGFLIHTKYILTAAHCIHSEFSRVRGEPYSVLFGEHNTTTKIDCSPGGTICADPVQISRINKIVVHEKYEKLSKHHHYDIALIHLRKAAKFTDFVQPICLLTNNNETDVKKYHISGWGKTETSESSPVKLRVDLVPFDKKECQEKFDMLGLEIDNTQICAGGEKLKDSCNGDSGGPLMSFNGTNYFASGLVSYGIGCGMPGWPGIYTSIPAYMGWIKAQIIDVSTRSPTIKRKRKNKKKTKENVAT